MTSRAASRVAVVDDDARVLESMAELLEAAGYAVDTYPSPRSLLASGLLQDLDCLITDIGMPEMDGFELCRQMRALRPDLPVIFVTARHDVADQQRADAQGHCGLFRKPFHAPALLAAVGRALKDLEPRGH
ncbi:MAG TPA: response regulator [Geminicoccus sp.]|uniref:response regulator transcription factor n=1 Tax=Geminicoccus sp. TaxID=2024832 RepID=UPI002B7E1C88|nr:response regulator [Geminicoccus sp.]HWL69683.1 response regulator [Geminicoccus sp.]